MNDTSTPTFRKTKDGGWVVFGPSSKVMPGLVGVAKKNGSRTREEVMSVSKEFAVDGIPCVYGYLAPKTAPKARRAGSCRNCGGPIESYSDSSSVCFDCF